MVTLLTVIHIVVCLFLILVVLLQAGKGGGMGIAFGGAGSQTVFGSSGAGNFLTRLTSVTATLFLLTSLALAHYSSRQDSKRLQDLAAQRAEEKKSENEKALKLKADLEKTRAAAVSGKDAGVGTTSPEAAGGAPGAAPTLQLRMPGEGPASGAGQQPAPKPSTEAPPKKKPSMGTPATNKKTGTAASEPDTTMAGSADPAPGTAAGAGDPPAPPAPVAKRRRPAPATTPAAGGEPAAAPPAAPVAAPEAPAPSAAPAE